MPSASGGFAPDPHRGSAPGPRWWTSVPRPPCCPNNQTQVSEWAVSLFVFIGSVLRTSLCGTTRNFASREKKYLRILVSIGLASGVAQRRSARPPRCRLSVGPWTLAVYTDEKRLEAAKNAKIWRALIGAESNTLTLRVDRVVSLFLVSKRSCV